MPSKSVSLKIRALRGFSLIELMIVITIFGLVTVAIVVSYISFEQNQRLNNAAKMLKTDIRFALSKTLNGDKSTPNCTADTTNITKAQLWGWFVKVDVTSNPPSYTINSDCLATFAYTTAPATSFGTCSNILDGVATRECWYTSKTVSLPTNVNFQDFYYNSVPNASPNNSITVLFVPLKTYPSFGDYRTPYFISPPVGGVYSNNSYVTSGINQSAPHCGSNNQLEIAINLSTDVSSQYYICVNGAGEVNDYHLTT